MLPSPPKIESNVGHTRLQASASRPATASRDAASAASSSASRAPARSMAMAQAPGPGLADQGPAGPAEKSDARLWKKCSIRKWGRIEANSVGGGDREGGAGGQG